MKIALALCLLLASTASARPLSAYTSGDKDYLETIVNLLAFAHDVTGLSNVTACWQNTTVRGVGVPIHACDANHPDQDAGLCYVNCKPGYDGVGPVCWQRCPSGWTDTGAFCSKAGSIVSADNSNCPWYDKCGLTFAKGCSTCPAHDPAYHNDGCTCRVDPKTIAKDSYGRGVGVPLGCAPNEDYDAGLCYSKCLPGFHGVGPVCWEDCTATEFPYSCGAICAATQATCNTKVSEMSTAVISAFVAAVEAGDKDPQKIMAAVKAALEAILGFVMPICWTK